MFYNRLILIVVGSLFMMGADDSCETSSDVETPSSGPGSEAEVLQVEAAALVAEFDANQIAAEEKYNGKIIQTTAFVQNISSALGSYYASLSPNKDLVDINNPNPSFTTIQCMTEKEQLTSLVNGQQVTVKGKVSGQSLGIIELDDCSVIG